MGVDEYVGVRGDNDDAADDVSGGHVDAASCPHCDVTIAWIVLAGVLALCMLVGALVSQYIDAQTDRAAFEAGYVQQSPEHGYRPIWVKPAATR
jgi:hypothetical protein